VPDFIGPFRQGFDVCRQMIMRVGQDKDFHLMRWIGRSAGDAKCGFAI
jgi:hypothetical protein